MAGNEELAPFMENANGVYANPRGYEGALAQTGAMDAQALRQGQIQEQLRGYLGANPMRSGLPAQKVPSAEEPPGGYSMDKLADAVPGLPGGYAPGELEAIQGSEKKGGTELPKKAAQSGGQFALPVPPAASPFVEDVGNVGNWAGNNIFNPIAEYFTGTDLPNNLFTGLFGGFMNELNQGNPIDALMTLFGKGK